MNEDQIQKTEKTNEEKYKDLYFSLVKEFSEKMKMIEELTKENTELKQENERLKFQLK